MIKQQRFFTFVIFSTMRGNFQRIILYDYSTQNYLLIFLIQCVIHFLWNLATNHCYDAFQREFIIRVSQKCIIFKHLLLIHTLYFAKIY
jgi:hypothetical protein